MQELKEKRVAVLVSDGFEEAELTEPVKTLRNAGAKVDIVSMQQGHLQAFKHHQPTITVTVDKTFDDVSPEDYDAVMLPGGALNADGMRTDRQAQAFVKEIDRERKPVAAICHAPWLLVSSGLVEGRSMTSWPTIADDVRNAGGNWVDRDVVVDGNLVTSRGPSDLPAFNRAMCELFAKGTVDVG